MKILWSTWVFVVVILGISSISGCAGKETAVDQNVQDSVQVDTDPKIRSIERIIATQNPIDRFAWQKPNLILDLLGDVKGKTIADIGAGYGFFTLMIPFREAEIVAIDIDTMALGWITQTAQKLPQQIRDRIEVRLALPDDPLLAEGEVDIAIIVNTLGYISKKQAYLEILKKGIKPGGMLMIVDYKTKRIPLLIPESLKLHLSDVEELLYESGYTDIMTDDCILDFQYVVRAVVPESF